jgi:hypothetical protein
MIMNALQIRNHKIGDRVVLNAGDQGGKKRRATVIADCGEFYLTQTDNGYRECLFKTKLIGE